MAQSIDPNDSQLHRVRLDYMTKYRAGVLEKVPAFCGKVWSPTFRVTRMNRIPRCPICFPQEKNRYAVAK